MAVRADRKNLPSFPRDARAISWKAMLRQRLNLPQIKVGGDGAPTRSSLGTRSKVKFVRVTSPVVLTPKAFHHSAQGGREERAPTLGSK